MIALLWLCLIVLPIVSGMGIWAVVYRKKMNLGIMVSEGGVLGCIACIGMTQVAHVIGMFLDLSLQTTGALLGGLMLFFAVAALAAVILLVRKKKDSLLQPMKKENERTVIPFLFLGLVLCQLLFIYCMQPMITPGDITLETVQSFLAEDGIYRVMPLTGQVSEAGIPLRYRILCLPTLYAILCNGFGVEVQLLVCHMIPAVVLAAAYLSYYYLSGVLFGKAAFRKRYLFMTMVALLLFLSDSGVFTNGYSALHSGYLGTSIRNLILVPYTFAAALERSWWKVVLCILAELCIAWTFWGVGICAAILVGMLVITLLEKKSPRLRGFLQIFLTKEDLA